MALNIKQVAIIAGAGLLAYWVVGRLQRSDGAGSTVGSAGGYGVTPYGAVVRQVTDDPGGLSVGWQDNSFSLFGYSDAGLGFSMPKKPLNEIKGPYTRV